MNDSSESDGDHRCGGGDDIPDLRPSENKERNERRVKAKPSSVGIHRIATTERTTK